MLNNDSHPSEQELLQAADGELSELRAKRLRTHLAACWTCRVRAREIEDTIAAFTRLHRQTLDPLLPPADGPRALLMARLAQVAESSGDRRWFELGSWRNQLFGISLACLIVVFMGTFALVRWKFARVQYARDEPISVPNKTLTPGAAIMVTKDQLCGEAVQNNRPVPASLQRKVFAEYGIAGSDPRAFEVDYLITPALGGSDDIHNLWPHSYSATIWNARVKDALENRLHELVCGGQLDPVTAQREIAGNWIGAYKKYLHTDRPLDTQQ